MVLAEVETAAQEDMVASTRNLRSNLLCHHSRHRSAAARDSTVMTDPTLRHDHEHEDPSRRGTEGLLMQVAHPVGRLAGHHYH